ncbi:MAG: hypothetical protein KH353_12520 [Clostridium sp.]|jgi:hypothetical protein|nr:hypothetical protein [Clostridium sp.]
MKLTEKMKKNLAILGGVLIGIGLIAAIGMQFGSKPSGEDVLPGTGETETELIVDPGDFEKKEEESKVVSREEESLVIHPGIGENQETDTQAVDSRSPQTDQTTQSIQPKPTKPEPPSKEILTDPTQKPDGTKQDTPPIPVDHEAVEKPSEPVADPEQPQAGDTSGNQIYVPGFGWVENHGGGGSGTAAEDMYENGNKIGIMD